MDTLYKPAKLLCGAVYDLGSDLVSAIGGLSDERRKGRYPGTVELVVEAMHEGIRGFSA